MTNYIEHAVSYKLTFSMGELTEEEVTFVRKAMNKLAKKKEITRCFQNVHGNVHGLHPPTPTLISCPDFSIYYTEEGLDCLNKFLFKMQLKFPNFVVHTSRTMQEYS